MKKTIFMVLAWTCVWYRCEYEPQGIFCSGDRSQGHHDKLIAYQVKADHEKFAVFYSCGPEDKLLKAYPPKLPRFSVEKMRELETKK